MIAYTTTAVATYGVYKLSQLATSFITLFTALKPIPSQNQLMLHNHVRQEEDVEALLTLAKVIIQENENIHEPIVKAKINLIKDSVVRLETTCRTHKLAKEEYDARWIKYYSFDNEDWRHRIATHATRLHMRMRLFMNL